MYLTVCEILLLVLIFATTDNECVHGFSAMAMQFDAGATVVA